MKTVTVYLAEQQIEKLDNLAEQTGIQKSEHIRRAVDQYLNLQPGQKEKVSPTITLARPE